MAVDIDPAISGQDYSYQTHTSYPSTDSPISAAPALGFGSESKPTSNSTKHFRKESGPNYTTQTASLSNAPLQISPTSVSSSHSSMSNCTVDLSKDLRATMEVREGVESTPLSHTFSSDAPVQQPMYQSNLNIPIVQSNISTSNEGLQQQQSHLSHQQASHRYLSSVPPNIPGPITPVGSSLNYLPNPEGPRDYPQQSQSHVTDLLSKPIAHQPLQQQRHQHLRQQQQQQQQQLYYNQNPPRFGEYEGGFLAPAVPQQQQQQQRPNMPPPYQQPRAPNMAFFIPTSDILLSGNNNSNNSTGVLSGNSNPDLLPTSNIPSNSRMFQGTNPVLPFQNYMMPPNSQFQIQPPGNYMPYTYNSAQQQPQQLQHSPLSFTYNTNQVSDSNPSSSLGQLETEYTPLHVGSWDNNSLVQSQRPYKSLILVPGETLEQAVMSRLSCKNNSNEYSPIFKSDTRFNSSSISSRLGRGKISRVENLLRTGGTSRLYQFPGLYSGRGNPMDEENQVVSGQEILEQVISAIYAAIGTNMDLASYMSPITDISITEAGREPSRGIKKQLDLPDGVSLIMDARHKQEIEQTFMKWTSNRPKTENFFRLEDKKGLSFSLGELKEALDIIMSRPPRRINNYVARQLLTDVTYGQGRGVTEFNSSQLTHLHSLSKETRQPGGLAPAGSSPFAVPGGSIDVVQSVHYKISHEDTPFVNSKKSSQYDPYYCRRQGIHKEGWCGYCKMGGWYLMKNSGYLYHQNHEHGIFPGGCIFEDPLVIRRKVIREARWEGLCGICYHWVDLDHTDRKLWGTWYRHYKLCVNEYEEIKKVLRSTCAPIELVEIKYTPGDNKLTND